MNIKYRYILIIFCFILLFSNCREKRIEITVKNPSGTVIEKYQVNKDSIKDGTYVSFYESGDTFELSYYQDGKLEGPRWIYYENSNVEIEEYYQNDTLNGSYKSYYPSGALKRSMQFVKNSIVGTLKVYYENGQLKEEVSMKNNEENGPFVEYYKNGQKSWEGTYHNGPNERGMLVQFAENGDTIRKMMCDERYICRTFYRNEHYPEKESE